MVFKRGIRKYRSATNKRIFTDTEMGKIFKKYFQWSKNLLKLLQGKDKSRSLHLAHFNNFLRSFHSGLWWKEMHVIMQTVNVTLTLENTFWWHSQKIHVSPHHLFLPPSSELFFQENSLVIVKVQKGKSGFISKCLSIRSLGPQGKSVPCSLRKGAISNSSWSLNSKVGMLI